MDDFLDIGACLLGIGTLVMAVGFGLISGINYFVERPSCYAQWRDSGYEVRWSFWGDCQLSKDGKHWIVDEALIQMDKDVKVHE